MRKYIERYEIELSEDKSRELLEKKILNYAFQLNPNYDSRVNSHFQNRIGKTTIKSFDVTHYTSLGQESNLRLNIYSSQEINKIKISLVYDIESVDYDYLTYITDFINSLKFDKIIR